MPAPTPEALLKFGDNLVVAGVAVLRADGLPAFGPREKVELPKERLDVTSSGWTRASQQMVQDSLGNWHYSHQRGVITVGIVSQRGDAAQAARHGDRVGRVRWLFGQVAQQFTQARLPYYGILLIEESSEDPPSDDSTETDRTDLTFNVEIQILPYAIPV